MNHFQITPNEYLSTPIEAWYHSEYHGGHWQQNGSIENIICTLKNDINIKPPTDSNLLQAANMLTKIAVDDLRFFKNNISSNLTVCVVPRAKVQYLQHQLFFKKTIKDIASALSLNDGTDYIIRTKNTRTTHRDSSGHGGDGDRPYPGITKDTCTILKDVKGKNILLIDDVYTKTINIDEDCIQALLDNGAESVIFYSIGYTI